MKLKELSRDYLAAARQLRVSLKTLRCAYRASEDREERWRLKMRISRLEEMLTQMRELAEHTERYYEKGFYRGRYSL